MVSGLDEEKLKASKFDSPTELQLATKRNFMEE